METPEAAPRSVPHGASRGGHAAFCDIDECKCNSVIGGVRRKSPFYPRSKTRTAAGRNVQMGRVTRPGGALVS